MPELPEVERLRQSLLPHLLGARITRARLLRSDVLHRAKGAARAAGAALLDSATIADTHRRGKHLALVATDGRVLLVHLGMSGQVLVLPEGQSAPTLTHVHARWTLSRPDGSTREVLFRDPRRFGGLWAFPSIDALHADHWHTLGPDALGVTGQHLAHELHASRRAVKAALLDQTVLAGVGNIYADEALFRAGIDPRSACAAIRPEQWDQLAQVVREVLLSAIASGGSTLRDYVDADGEAGQATAQHRVYGRSGEACLVCDTPLLDTRLAQRTTVWCPRCQEFARGQREHAAASSDARR